MNRRSFFKHALYSSAPFIVPSHVLGGRYVAPSDKIVMGCIGVGNMGSGHVRSFLGYQDVHISAVCDVRRQHSSRAKRMIDGRYGNSDCVEYDDFRELLSRPDIDAVTVVVPDHWHVLIGLEAVRQGKDMYYEKPLSRSIFESQAIRNAVKAQNVVFQFGTQQRSDHKFRYAIELVRNGYIGELETVMIGSASYEQISRQPEQPVPEGFNYDFWLGPAPWAPYTFERCTRQWTLIADYSLGCISGAWGIHSVDMVQLVNRSDDATPVTCEGSLTIPTEGFYDTAQYFEIEHVYKNGLRLLHMDMATAKKRAKQFELFHMAILFLGSEGWIYVGRGFLAAEPKSILTAKLSTGDDHIPFSNDHHRNFLDCVKSRQTPVSSIDSAFYSDVTCHQEYIAASLGKKLTWNGEKEQFTDADANRLLKRSMRSPWCL